MLVLVINCGSSSIKYQLINTASGDIAAKGLVEKIGEGMSKLTHIPHHKEAYIKELEIENHVKGIQIMIDAILDKEYGVIKDITEIQACGHRTVHGGESFSDSVLINDRIIEKMKDCIELAPLHNPANIKGIEACKNLMPDVPQVGVFDTAFHQTMPQKAYLYGIPYELYQKYHIRRYGFHGTSHLFVSLSAANLLGKDIEDTKIITCHLGNGASIAAIDGGKSVDTSMGFTPLEGLLMGTRTGDMDPAVVLYLMKKLNLSEDEANLFLNKKCGVAGLSGLGNDMRDIDDGVIAGDERAIRAFDVYNYRIQKYIGSYAAAMGGVDAIVFTGGVGENSPMTRRAVLEPLKFMGVDVVWEENAKRKKIARDISTPEAKVKVFIIPTNEEYMIAKETERILKVDA